jgi:uncharacterized protein YceH (UPF0502 family)
MDTQTSDQQPQEATLLNPIEARILGALMEKQMTTPEAYPLTLNSLVLACNQKTSREPVMNLEEGEVRRCLYALEEKKLIEVDYSSRADKFLQRLSRFHHFSQPEQAIFCVMMLRGPQTLNELLSRTKRMQGFDSLEELEAGIDRLLHKTNPLLKQMPHQPGQREQRYMHLLCGEPDPVVMSSSVVHSQAPAQTDALVERVNELEKQVAWLMEKLKD